MPAEPRDQEAHVIQRGSADHLRSPSGGTTPSHAGFGGVQAYPDFATKAAVLCWHLVKNHPLPDGNKRCTLLATVEFVERKHVFWSGREG